MAEKTAYIVVRLDISNPKVDDITDEDINDIISEVDYQFNKVGDYKIETEIYGSYDGSVI